MDTRPDTLRDAFLNGIVDRHEHGLLRNEQLYRRTKWHRLAWAAGWRLANEITSRRLRIARRKRPLTVRAVS